MHLAFRFVTNNTRSSGVAACGTTSGLRDNGLKIRGFVVDPGNDRRVAVLRNAGIWDSVGEVRNCRGGARNNIKNVRAI